MEKNFKNITNITPRNPSERIRNIEQKLQLITEAKTQAVKEEKVNNSQQKILGLQKNSAELIRRVETQLKQQKELLKELTREYEETSCKQELSIRNRVLEINQLQNRISGLIKAELQRSKEAERKAIAMYEDKIETLRLQVNREIEARKEYFLSLDTALSEKLPGVQAEIADRLQSSTDNLDRIQQQIESETQAVCKQIQDSQRKQHGSFEELMKMMSSVIAEIKEEIATEKESRLASKKKLLALFDGAYTKLAV